MRLFLSCSIQEKACDVIPLVEKIKHNEPSKHIILEEFVNVEKAYGFEFFICGER